MSGLPSGWVVEEYTEVLPRPGDLPYSYNFTRTSWRVKDDAGNVVYAGAYEQNARQQAQAIYEST
jgi:hypothetical protein